MTTIKMSEQNQGQRAAWKDGSLPQVDNEVIFSLISLVNSYLHHRFFSCPEGVDREQVKQFAREHGIAGLFGWLNDNSLIEDDELGEWGNDQYFSNIINHEKMRRNLLPLQKISQRLGLDYSVVKGPALADHVYEDGGIRSYGDVDILVRSFNDVEKFVHSPYFQEQETTYHHDPHSLTEPGRAHAKIGGNQKITFEFFFPQERICDPMFDFIQQHGESILGHNSEGKYRVPPATLHFIFVLFHMQKHLCMRLIWHLDVLKFYLKYKEQLDFDLIEYELNRLQLNQLTENLSTFYRNYFNVDMVLVQPRVRKGWNIDISRKIASVDQLHGQMSVNRVKQNPISVGVLVGIRFFVITDPEHQGLFSSSKAAFWLSSLLQLKTGVKSPLFVKILARSMHLLKPFLVLPVRYLLLKLYRYNKKK